MDLKWCWKEILAGYGRSAVFTVVNRCSGFCRSIYFVLFIEP